MKKKAKMTMDKLRKIADKAQKEACIWELHFEKVQWQNLYDALVKIKDITTDPLTEKIINNTLEKHEIDKLIHTRFIFSKDILNNPPF